MNPNEVMVFLLRKRAPPLPFCRGLASNQIFKKVGLYRTSTFRGGLLGKGGVTFFGGGGELQFSQKK